MYWFVQLEITMLTPKNYLTIRPIEFQEDTEMINDLKCINDYCITLDQQNSGLL